MFKIGNLKLKNNVVLAPMAGICNSAFRRIIKKMGCGLIYAEMVSNKAILYDNQKTIDMLYTTRKERPIAQQIFGSDKESFVKAAKLIEKKMHPDIIDINMGCPVPKVAVKSQAGSALLKNPDKVYEIVKAVKDSVNVPVTVKIRSGWDQNSINACLIAKKIEEAGADAITIHPRTRSQGYSGKANWNIIKEVKQSVNIPVIGNGDIKTIYDAKKMIDETNCDAVMIGRAALTNPYLIKQIIYYLKKNTILKPLSDNKKINLCIKHYKYLLKIKNEKQATLEMRTFAANYIKGMYNSIYIKQKLYKINNKKDFMNLIKEYKKILKNKEKIKKH